MPRSISLAVIRGDGIGPEVVAEGLKVLRAAVPGHVSLETAEYDLGARRWRQTGETLPDSMLAELRGHDAILFGAIGDPSVPAGILERGVLLRLRFAFDHYVNLRPGRLFSGVPTPRRWVTRSPRWSADRLAGRGHRGCQQTGPLLLVPPHRG